MLDDHPVHIYIQYYTLVDTSAAAAVPCVITLYIRTGTVVEAAGAEGCEKSALGKFNKCAGRRNGHARGRVRASWMNAAAVAVGAILSRCPRRRGP